jgi:hypothetical protein
VGQGLQNAQEHDVGVAGCNSEGRLRAALGRDIHPVDAGALREAETRKMRRAAQGGCKVEFAGVGLGECDQLLDRFYRHAGVRRQEMRRI